MTDIQRRYGTSAIEALAKQARPIDDDDWGSERQIASENAFNVLMEQTLTPQQFEFWEGWGEKATTDERIDEALSLLRGTSASFARWRKSRR